MPWVRIDDHFDEHPKLAAVGPVGWGMWLAGLAYCNRNLTDGFIPYSIAEGIGGGWLVRMPIGRDHNDRTGHREGLEEVWHVARRSEMSGDDVDATWVIQILVTYELWDEVPGGYQVHDYSDFQPLKAEVLAERVKKQAAGQAGGRASAKARGQAQSKPVPVPVPEGSLEPPLSPLEHETPFVMLTPEEKAAYRQREQDELNAKTKARLGVQ